MPQNGLTNHGSFVDGFNKDVQQKVLGIFLEDVLRIHFKVLNAATIANKDVEEFLSFSYPRLSKCNDSQSKSKKFPPWTLDHSITLEISPFRKYS